MELLTKLVIFHSDIWVTISGDWLYCWILYHGGFPTSGLGYLAIDQLTGIFFSLSIAGYLSVKQTKWEPATAGNYTQ